MTSRWKWIDTDMELMSKVKWVKDWCYNHRKEKSTCAQIFSNNHHAFSSLAINNNEDNGCRELSTYLGKKLVERFLYLMDLYKFRSVRLWWIQDKMETFHHKSEVHRVSLKIHLFGNEHEIFTMKLEKHVSTVQDIFCSTWNMCARRTQNNCNLSLTRFSLG